MESHDGLEAASTGAVPGDLTRICLPQIVAQHLEGLAYDIEYSQSKTRAMRFEENLYQIEYLVFSAHKTGTQTISQTLMTNNIPCIHCHRLSNYTIKMESGLFADYLENYYRHNARKLVIVTVFREPLERHVSSFFQWHGQGVIAAKEKINIESTIIHTTPIPDLQQSFVKEIEQQTLVGRRESIDEICEELNLEIVDLKFDASREHGFADMKYCCIYTFRFDTLFKEKNFESMFSRMIGRPIVKRDANLSAKKWYKDILIEFKQTLRIPQSTIISGYESKRAIIEHFYPGQFDRLLIKALDRYA